MFDFSLPASTGTLPVSTLTMPAPEATEASLGQDDLLGTPPPGAR
jgi:hypothetical protein